MQKVAQFYSHKNLLNMNAAEAESKVAKLEEKLQSVSNERTTLLEHIGTSATVMKAHK